MNIQRRTRTGIRLSLTLMVLTACLALPFGSPAAEDFLSEPEGIAFDSLNNRYLISNWVDGSIAAIDIETGIRSLFKTGLGNCAGIFVHQNTVYVSCNNRNLMGFDLTTGAEVMDLTLSTAGLHGMAADSSGFLYAADWGENKIYRIKISDQSFSTFVFGALSQPMGLLFEADKNRLLVTSMSYNTPIQAVSLPDGTVTFEVSHSLGYLDGIAKDAAGNYYITTIRETYNEIYRYDSAFTDPPELIVDSLAGLVDAVYNDRENELAYVISYLHEFHTIQMEIAIEADTTLGWAPLEIEFFGSSEHDVATWLWDFGDEATGSGQTATHTYQAPGMYDVTLQGITVGDDTLSRTRHWFVAALADSLYPDSVELKDGDNLVEVTVYARNNTPLHELIIPVEYGGDIDLTYDSYSLAGCGSEGFDDVKLVHNDPGNKRLTLRLRTTTGSAYLTPGLSAAVKLFFEPTPGAASGDQVVVAVDGYDTRLPDFLGLFGSYSPLTAEGKVVFVGCCQLRGDIDHNGVIDISDITSFVEYFFASGESPECEVEADANEDSFVNISDLTYLVEYLFGGGPAPTGC